MREADAGEFASAGPTNFRNRRAQQGNGSYADTSGELFRLSEPMCRDYRRENHYQVRTMDEAISAAEVGCWTRDGLYDQDEP